MMGGAAVAGGEDQATAFINPAGITRIPGQSFSFSTVAVEMKNRTVKSALDPSAGLQLKDADSSQLQVKILPNTFCLFLDGPPQSTLSRKSRHKYALCAAGTEREEFDFTQNDTAGSSSDIQTTGAAHDTSMKFVRSTLALSWGLQLNRDTSIGVTTRVDNARFQDRSSASAFISDGNTGVMQAVQLSRNAWSWDTSLVVGLTSHINRVLTLGVSLTTPSQHLFGSYEGHSSVARTWDDRQSLVQDSGDFRYNHPGSIRMGLAFNWPRLTLEVNGSFYGPQKQLARATYDRTASLVTQDDTLVTTTERTTIAERGRAVTNLALGAEFFLQRDFSIVAGLHSDFSGLQKRQDAAPTNVLFRQEKDMYYASVGVSTYRKSGRLLLGLRGHYGAGTILIADAAAATPKMVSLGQSQWGLSLVVSGEISFRSVRDTAVRAATPLANISSSDDEKEGQK